MLFPNTGRRQATPNVRKLVSRKRPYLVYYQANEQAGEVVILTVRHPAPEREHDDA